MFFIHISSRSAYLFYVKYCEVYFKTWWNLGAWNALPLETQQAHLARMSEDLVIDLERMFIK